MKKKLSLFLIIPLSLVLLFLLSDSDYLRKAPNIKFDEQETSYTTKRSSELENKDRTTKLSKSDASFSCSLNQSKIIVDSVHDALSKEINSQLEEIHRSYKALNNLKRSINNYTNHGVVNDDEQNGFLEMRGSNNSEVDVKVANAFDLGLRAYTTGLTENDYEEMSRGSSFSQRLHEFENRDLYTVFLELRMLAALSIYLDSGTQVNNLVFMAHALISPQYSQYIFNEVESNENYKLGLLDLLVLQAMNDQLFSIAEKKRISDSLIGYLSDSLDQETFNAEIINCYVDTLDFDSEVAYQYLSSLRNLRLKSEREIFMLEYADENNRIIEAINDKRYLDAADIAFDFSTRFSTSQFVNFTLAIIIWMDDEGQAIQRLVSRGAFLPSEEFLSLIEINDRQMLQRLIEEQIPIQMTQNKFDELLSNNISLAGYNIILSYN
ncbi:MAG: hypothetical protein ABNH21_13095 [Glaciecola sp.]|jgi:hypothetical protein